MTSNNMGRVEKIKEKWETIAKSSGVDQLFEGTGYITIGYYKTDSETVAQSALNMTVRLSEISEIGSSAHILDLGCGWGRPVLDIAVRTGASVVGVDLAEGQIDMANKAAELYKNEKKPDLKAEFYAASYFDLPEAVTNQTFTHVMMQTSLFYAHHRIDEIFNTISRVLQPGGVLVVTDFLRVSDTDDLSAFKEFNSMPEILSMEEMKAALTKAGLEYCDGENLDYHCVKCNAETVDKITQENIQGLPPVEFFKMREETVKNKKVTFQIVVAKKV